MGESLKQARIVVKNCYVHHNNSNALALSLLRLPPGLNVDWIVMVSDSTGQYLAAIEISLVSRVIISLSPWHLKNIAEYPGIVDRRIDTVVLLEA